MTNDALNLMKEIMIRHNDSLREVAEFTFSVLEIKKSELLRTRKIFSPCELFHDVSLPILFELCMEAEELIGKQYISSYKKALNFCSEQNRHLTYLDLVECAKAGKHEFGSYVNHLGHTIGTCKVCTYKRVIEGIM